ncbi:MAG: hypothetical protein ABFQ64_03815 [Campylobacterota bacterium]
MSEINIKEGLSESLKLYYNSLESGDIGSLKTLMTEESYMITLDSLGFKRAFKDSHFKALLEDIGENKSSLIKIEEVISEELRNQAKKHNIDVVNTEENGAERFTLHYLEDKQPKKMYFSSASGEWKIDYMAGRKVN